jgi:hypothetical protein
VPSAEHSRIVSFIKNPTRPQTAHGVCLLLMADYGIQLGKVIFVSLLGVILTIDIVVGLQALYYWQLGRDEASESLYQPPPKLEALVNAQRAVLADYRIVDAKKGTVSIPINRAMDLVLAELSKQNPPPEKTKESVK